MDRYARRRVIENTIADAVDFFHMDVLSAAVPMKIDVDVQLTLMVSTLYRMLGRRIEGGMEAAKTKTMFHKLVRTSATLHITDEEVIVRLNRRANNPRLINAGYAASRTPVPWLANRQLRIHIP